MNILIVDSSAAMRMMIIRTLRQAGFGGHDIEQASDGVEALDSIRRVACDLVLADWNMPNMTGLELLRALRHEGNQVTFGFITTDATPPMRAKAEEAGAKFMISKPITVDTFEKTLGGIIN